MFCSTCASPVRCRTIFVALAQLLGLATHKHFMTAGSACDFSLRTVQSQLQLLRTVACRPLLLRGSERKTRGTDAVHGLILSIRGRKLHISKAIEISNKLLTAVS